MNTTNLIKAISNAISAESTAVNRWKTAGQAVREYYPHSLDQFDSEKKALVELIIFPALPADIRSALSEKLPRKGTPEALQFKPEALEEKSQAKIRARAYQDTIWKRVRGYAFEAELEAIKAEKEAKRAEEKEEEGEDEIDDAIEKAKTLEARILLMTADIIKRCQQAESAPFDIVEAVRLATALNACVAKGLPSNKK